MIGCDVSVRRNRTGCEAPRSREHPVPLRARTVPVCCEGQWHLPTQARMTRLGVVVAAPALENGTGMRHQAERGLVQKLVAAVAAGSVAEPGIRPKSTPTALWATATSLPLWRRRANQLSRFWYARGSQPENFTGKRQLSELASPATTPAWHPQYVVLSRHLAGQSCRYG